MSAFLPVKFCGEQSDPGAASVGLLERLLEASFPLRPLPPLALHISPLHLPLKQQIRLI